MVLLKYKYKKYIKHLLGVYYVIYTKWYIKKNSNKNPLKIYLFTYLST